MRRTILLALLTAAAGSAASAPDDSFLIRGATVHTMTGEDISNGSVLVRNGKIAGVGQRLAAPPGTRIIEAKGLHVYPGIIDSGSDVGLQEIGAVRDSNDFNELGTFNPQLKAAVAVNPSSEHIPVVRANGVTTVLALPSSEGRRGGADNLIVGGQASLIRLDGWTSDEMTMKTGTAMVMRMPAIQTRRPGGSFEEAKKNYEKQLQEINEFFESARRYKLAKAAGRSGFQPDLKLEAMQPVVDRQMPVLISAQSERSIRDAIAFGEQQKVKIILANPDEAAKVAKEIAEKKIPVVLGPTLSLPREEDAPYDRQFTTPVELYRAGVKFAFASLSTEFSRNVPYQAAAAAGFGLPHEEAMKALTINAAQIWGVEKQVGSIEEGKWADLMITDGDPLEEPTQVRLLFIKGKAVDLENKHHRLYEKYLNRP